MTVGQNIRFYRKDRSLTQKQLGELLGQAQNTIAQWESGYTQPSFGQLERLAEALNVNCVSFLPDGWSFLEENDVSDTEAYESALADAKQETDTIIRAKNIAIDFNNRFLSEVEDVPEVYIRNAISNALIALNRDGLWQAYARVNELSELKKYNK